MNYLHRMRKLVCIYILFNTLFYLGAFVQVTGSPFSSGIGSIVSSSAVSTPAAIVAPPDQLIQLTATPIGADVPRSYIWMFNGEQSSDQTLNINAPSGVYTATVTATYDSGVIVTSSTNVTVVSPNLVLTVTNNNDSGLGSLRQALIDLNGKNTGVVTFAENLGPIKPLTSFPELTTSEPASIIGPQLSLLTIDGENLAGESALIYSGSGSLFFDGRKNINVTNMKEAPAIALNGPAVIQNTIFYDNYQSIQANFKSTIINNSHITTLDRPTSFVSLNQMAAEGSIVGYNTIDITASTSSMSFGVANTASSTSIYFNQISSGNNGRAIAFLVSSGSAIAYNIIKTSNIGISLANCTNHKIVNNEIRGLGPSRTDALQNIRAGDFPKAGILAQDTTHNLLSNNKILDIDGHGMNFVETTLESLEHTVVNNIISGNSGSGINFGNNSHTNTAKCNIITNNGNGITADGPRSVKNKFTKNSIFGNEFKGIELTNGANNNQNFPILLSAQANGNTIVVTGSLASLQNTTFNIEFFRNLDDKGPLTEGKEPLGNVFVKTDENGNALFTGRVLSPETNGFVSATALVAEGFHAGDTSEYSLNIPITPGTPQSAIAFAIFNKYCKPVNPAQCQLE